jgi:hypothetical protein
MPDALRTSEVLWRASELLRVRGWNGRGGWHDEKGCLCAGAAIGVVLGTPDRPTAIFDDQPRWSNGDGPAVWNQYTRIVSLLSDEYLRGGPFDGNLYAFNDAPGRTLDEVLELLKTAARAEERKERGEATGDPPGQGPDHDGDRG